MCLQRLKTAERINPLPIETSSQGRTEINRALLTLNRLDFKRLHGQMPGHAGIIICTEDSDRVGQAQRVTASIAEVGELKGQLIRVYRLP